VNDSPRAAAATALGRVLRAGAYSNVLLAPLGDDPDGRLVRRLVYGTLRHLVRIDRLLAQAASRPLDAIEPGLLDLLRIATWELRFGDGAPHAAVNEAVTVAGARFGKPVTGFANAVLRSVQRAEEHLPAGDEGASLELGIAPWIYRRLRTAWGDEETRAFLTASLLPAGRTGRVRPGADGGAGEPVDGIPGAIAGGPVGPGVLPMDPASVAVGLAAEVSPGMSVLDMAAAPGGKTMHVFDQLEGRGMVVAADAHARRVRSGRSRLERLDVVVPWIVADGRRPPFPPAVFDRVLLDAPCTGLGTLRRRPEIRHRLDPESPDRSAELQRQLLASALRLVKPGGFVVYSACTVFPEETVDVVDGLAAEPPSGLPGRIAGRGWLLAPHLTGTDGMFISLVRP